MCYRHLLQQQTQRASLRLPAHGRQQGFELVPELAEGLGSGDLGVTLIGKLNPWVVLKSNKIKELWRPRSLLYRRRFLRPNTHFAAFFEIYKIQKPLHRSKRKILQNFDDSFLRICQILTKFSFDFQEENL